MRQPETPPSRVGIFHRIHEENRLATILAAVKSPLIAGDYVHWDRLRRLQPPEGLSLQEWWYGLKFARIGGQRVPLVDKAGQQFEFNLTGRIPEHLHEIDLVRAG